MEKESKKKDENIIVIIKSNELKMKELQKKDSLDQIKIGKMKECMENLNKKLKSSNTCARNAAVEVKRLRSKET